MPKFSIKQLLLLVGVFSLVSILLAMASRGSLVAYGLVVAFLLTVIPLMSLAVIYTLARMVSRKKGHVPQPFASPSFGPDQLEDQG